MNNAGTGFAIAGAAPHFGLVAGGMAFHAKRTLIVPRIAAWMAAAGLVYRTRSANGSLTIKIPNALMSLQSPVPVAVLVLPEALRTRRSSGLELLPKARRNKLLGQLVAAGIHNNHAA